MAGRTGRYNEAEVLHDCRRIRRDSACRSGCALSDNRSRFAVGQGSIDLGEVLGRYTQVLVPEMNLGQLSRVLRSEFLVDAKSLNKMQGHPFRVGEIESAIAALLGGM